MTTILSIFGLFSMNVATPVSAASLTLSVPTDALKLDLQPNNTFSKSSASSVSVKTDAFAGYTLSIKAKSSNDLVNGGNKISSITGNLTEDQYKASGNTNTWGYQPSKINGSANTAFLPGPTTSLSTIEKTNAKNDTANSYSFVIGSKVDSNTPNGSYSNTFVFTATANAVSYNITYNLNQGSWTGTSPQTGNTVDNTVAISGVSPSRSGYTFQGWCTKSTTNDTCSGDTLQPGNKVTLANSTNNIQLYAMWKKLGPTMVDKGELGNMQSFSCATLNAATDESVEYGTVTDSRDNNEYRVARLKDGKCWMTENLRITGDSVKAAGVSVDLDSTNTDISGSGKFTIPDSNISKFNVGSNGYNTTTGKNNDAAYVTTASYTDSAYGAKNFESGYYTWHTATAGTGIASHTAKGWNAPSSICPKGWKLPTGGSGGDFETLTNAYDISNSTAGSNTLRGEPLNFTYAGLVNDSNGVLSGQGSGGYYWSSTLFDSTRAYYLSSTSSGVNSAVVNDRPTGLSVRCVASDLVEYSITYDPGLDACDYSVNSSEVNNMPSPNPQTGVATDGNVTLSSNTPTDPGFAMQGILTFKYWCDVKPTRHNVCPGTTYTPGSSYQITNGNTYTLYAIWDGSSSEPCPR